MLIRKPSMLDGSAIPSSEITPKTHFLDRRSLLKAAAASSVLAAAGRLSAPLPAVRAAGNLVTRQGSLSTTGEELTSFKDITSYNNFYEFGIDKLQPAQNAAALPIHPWTLRISGLVHQPRTFDLDSLLKLQPLENRTYRHRCVEGWSMVIPWAGYSLSHLLKLSQPLSAARYVQFVSYHNPAVQPWAAQCQIPWPYTEGLRLDEAMNPVTLLTVGLYGDPLPHQNGAPVRVIIPWKYGFKSPKSIVEIRLTDRQPDTTWNKINPEIYGFYSNVFPNLQHPRWNQKMERRIGQPFWAQKRSTLLFNGYGDFVSSLYAGLDLNRNF